MLTSTMTVTSTNTTIIIKQVASLSTPTTKSDGAGNTLRRFIFYLSGRDSAGRR
jgi:hypothetical protein